MNEVLRVENIDKSYRTEKGLLKKLVVTPVLKNVSLDIKRGEIVGLLGESGCGKSSLAKSIVNLTAIDSGSIFFEGVDISNMKEKDFHKYRQDIQYISQNPFTSFNNKMKVKDILLEAMEEYKLGTEEERMDRINYLLKSCKLPADSLGRYPYEFSGGQLQRLAIARALTVEPKLILADEIVSALDISVQSEILQLLMDLTKNSDLSILFISHDLAVVKILASRIYVMKDGEIVDSGDSDYIFKESRVEYTKKLVDSIPVFPY